jgi:hypothetical protein
MYRKPILNLAPVENPRGGRTMFLTSVDCIRRRYRCRTQLRFHYEANNHPAKKLFKFPDDRNSVGFAAQSKEWLAGCLGNANFVTKRIKGRLCPASCTKAVPSAEFWPQGSFPNQMPGKLYAKDHESWEDFL